MFNLSKSFLNGTISPFSPGDDYRWCYDRAAQQAARGAQRFAAGTAEQERSAANAERAQLTPFYRMEMNVQHAFTPEQTNELLNYAGATAAGSGATTAGEAASQAARTRNTSGFTPALDAAARDRTKALSTANLGVGAQDIAGAKEMNQEGARGMQGLYGTDTNAMLGAMGRNVDAINAEVNAGKSGWFQNLMQGIQTLTGGKGLGGKIPGLPS